MLHCYIARLNVESGHKSKKKLSCNTNKHKKLVKAKLNHLKQPFRNRKNSSITNGVSTDDILLT